MQEESHPQHRSKAREFVSQQRRCKKREERQERFIEEDDDEWVPVVPNMEAGGSYLQTSDPKKS